MNFDYIYNNNYVFKDRFDPEAGEYFNSDPEIYGRFFMTTNFVPDIRTLGLADYSERGKGSTNMKFDLANNTRGAHVSEFPVGTYKKCHRHGPGAHVIILQGEGYSLNWAEGDEPKRVDWSENAMFSPPDMWYHQHFNTGKGPARYLALKSKGAPEHPIRIGAPGPNTDPDFAKDHQIEYEDES